MEGLAAPFVLFLVLAVAVAAGAGLAIGVLLARSRAGGAGAPAGHDPALERSLATLEKLERTLREIENERHGHYGELREQLRQVGASHEKLHAETTNLVRALHSPQARGRWGEVQLRRVAELAGMTAHCDFFEQTTLAGELGGEGGAGSQRPDLVVRLPGDRCVVVDAKVPLEAYLAASEATDEAMRERLWQDHARQVRSHVASLASKAYWSRLDGAPEFVVMFLPGESFFSAALRAQPGLLEEGARQNVIVASPTTLIALLRAVAHGWRQQALAENAQQISALGRSLYERLATLGAHLEGVGRSLERAVTAYNKAVGSYETRVLVSARRFQELGASSSSESLSSPPRVECAPRAVQPASAD